MLLVFNRLNLLVHLMFSKHLQGSKMTPTLMLGSKLVPGILLGTLSNVNVTQLKHTLWRIHGVLRHLQMYNTVR